MTSLEGVGRATAVAAFLLGAPALSAQAPAADGAGAHHLRSRAYAYPAELGPAIDFLVLSPGAVAVAVGGGVALAGLDGWLVEPPRNPILGVASSDGVHLVTLQAGASPTDEVRLLRQKSGRRMEVVATLPAGRYDMAAVDDHHWWIWGHSLADDAWCLWYVRDGAPPARLVRSTSPLLAAAPIGAGGLLTVIDSRLVLLSSAGGLTALGRVRETVDGLAVNPAGTVFISSVSGIFAMRRPGELVLVASDVHGPLRFANGALYVLSRRHHAVLQLTL